MSPGREPKNSRKPKSSRQPTRKAKPRSGTGGGKRAAGKAAPKAGARSAEPTFPQAFAAVLRKRKIPVPGGLADAPPEAYANQPPSFAQQLEALSDDELRRYADRVASYATRQAERARAAWEASPLISELRRRGLPEPSRPRRAAGVNVSLKKPLAEWSDDDILSAAREWSERA